MHTLSVNIANRSAARRIEPFLMEVLDSYNENLHSIYIVGSALGTDYLDGKSDINSVFVLHEMDLDFLGILAPLGKRARKNHVAAPLIMTPDYIRSSTDVFPIEFLNFQLMHQAVYGQDILDDLEISLSDLRQQCERELKANLIGLRQGFLASLGNEKQLIQSIIGTLPASISLFRAIIKLHGGDPPTESTIVLENLGSVTGIDCSIFSEILAERYEAKNQLANRSPSLFKAVYLATERLSHFVDQISL